MNVYLSRPREVVEVISLIQRSGVAVPEPVTPIIVDRAIAAAALTYCEREFDYKGGPMPEFELGTPRWDAIACDVFEHLGIDSTDPHLAEAMVRS